MSDLIYRHEAIKTITSYNGMVDKSVAKRLLLQTPSAQPEIVRCKDCVYANHLSWLSEDDGKGIYLLCEKSYVQVSPCSFCSRAKMRGGNSE